MSEEIEDRLRSVASTLKDAEATREAAVADRGRAIIEARQGGMSYPRIGELLEISRTRIQQLEHAWMAKERRSMGGDGVMA
jgi:DNA-directed RNA polymerase sigma subunit (sigma70/sigma32)